MVKKNHVRVHETISINKEKFPEACKPLSFLVAKTLKELEAI